MWKSLDPQDRAYYEDIAKEEKERHKKLYPNYRYQPTSRRADVKQRNVKKLENGEEECQEIADIILKAQGKEGVVVRPEPSKAMKRAREATRSRKNGSTATPPRKRTKTAKANKCEAQGSEQVLQTVFLRPSPSISPTSDSSGGDGEFSAPSPDSFRLASRTPSIDVSMQQAAPADPSPVMEDLFGRRASSVPLLRICSPPPPFVSESQSPFGPVPLGSDSLTRNDGGERAMQNGLSSSIVQGRVDFADGLNMPAPAWKGRKALPPPILNTWQHCSYDDQSLPSPRSFDAMGAAGKQSMARPRTAFPSTPSSGSFRGFFHPWAYDDGTESMLISPMTASFQDMRRRSSLIRSGLVVGRRPGSFGLDPHGNAGARSNVTDGSHSLEPTSDSHISDVQLFEQAARAAEISLGAEASTVELDEAGAFAFDPALEGEGGDQAPSFAAQTSHREHHAVPSPVASPRLMTSSPRASFSGSTLAAAARDWASMKKRRSPYECRSVLDPVQDLHTAHAEGTMDSAETRVEVASKPSQQKSTLEESVERAVMLALGKDSGHGADRGERNSKIVQEILSSLSAEFSLQQPPTLSDEGEHGMTTAGKVPSPIVQPRRRSSLRGSLSASSYRSAAYFPGSTPAESYRSAKPLPSPLQLVMSNHEISSEAYSQSYPTSRHCN
ncbi:hypothetical protein NDA16_000212 [Ustilago loliicola]|nr:hypothetical protein NDA16_000212 [Ustilago loliicola]